jgi:hypothetical protein
VRRRLERNRAASLKPESRKLEKNRAAPLKPEREEKPRKEQSSSIKTRERGED